MDDLPLSTSSSFLPICQDTVEVELNASFSRTGTQHKIMPPGEEERDSQTNLVINNGLGSFFNNLETAQGNITVLHLQRKEKEADVMGKTDTIIVHSPDDSSKLKSDGFGITFTKGTLKDHFENVKPHQCSTCGKIFTHCSGLRKHIIRRVCERSYFDASKPYHCTSCGRSFTRRTCLSLHSEQSACQKKILRKSLFINKVKMTNRRGSLKKRISAIKSKAPQIFNCKFDGCIKAYASEEALRLHVQVHSMESDLPYELPQVQQLDVVSVDLSKICKKCGITFSQEESLKEHMIAQHKRKNRKESSIKYRCDFCGLMYKTLWWMKQHMKMKHPTEPADNFSETAQGLDIESQFASEISSPMSVASNEDPDFHADVVTVESDSVQLEEVYCNHQLDNQPAVNQSLVPETMFMRNTAENLSDDDSSRNIDQLDSINLLESLDNTMYICNHCGRTYKSQSWMKKHLSQVHQIINQNDFLEIIINLVIDPPPKHQSLLEPSQTCDTSIENDSNE